MPEQSYLPYVGHVLFPRRPDDLTSTTQCPACFTALAGTVCSVCGLDLGNPLAAELRAMSLESAAALDRRLEIIGRIRYESAHAVAPAQVTASPDGGVPVVPVPPVPAPAPAASAAAPTTVADPVAPLAPQAPPAEGAPRRHFGVQLILLIVGVSLVAIGAIFFLVYAFITFGLVWRSIIILAVTVAAFVSASLLRRRKLVATAEAIAALAVVFVYLDAFAIRANDLFGTASTDGLLYWGVVLVLSAVGFVGWSRLTGLRLPNVVGFAAFAPGIALIVAGVLAPVEDSVRVFSTFAALALAGLVHPIARPRMPERIIPLATAVAGTLAASFMAFFLDGNNDWSATIGLAIVALIAFVHLVLLVRTTAFRGFQYVFAALGGLLAAVAVVPAGFRMEQIDYLVIVPVVAAAVIALSLDLLARRITSAAAIAAARVAAASAAVVGGIALVVPIVFALAPVLETLRLAIPRWTQAATRLGQIESPQVWAVVALAVVTLLVAVFWAGSGVLARRSPVIVWAAVVTALIAAPLAAVLWAIVAVWLALGAAGVTALVVLRNRGVRTRVPIAVGAGAATVLAYTASWASLDVWWIGSVATIALLIAARLATPALAVRAALVGLAVAVALYAIGSQFWRLGELMGAAPAVDATHAVGGLATLFLIAAAVTRDRFVSALDTRVVFWMSFVTLALSAGLSWILGATLTPGDLVLPEFATSVALSVAAIVALLLWAVVPRTAAFGVERIAASVAIAPAVAWLGDSLTRLFVLPEVVLSIAPIAGALLVAAASLLIALVRPATTPRTAREVGIGLVAAPAIVSSVATFSPEAWLVLLLGAVVALLVAISRDGLVGSASPRKHLGWLALALATAGLWWRLGDSAVRTVEPYVLPLAGALLIVAVLAWRAARPQASSAAPLVALGGLLVAILPIAGFSTTGTVTRTIVIVAASAVLLLVASFLRGSSALRPYLDAAAIAGAAGVIVGGFGRAISISLQGDTTDYSADIWLGVSFAVLLLAAAGQLQLGRSQGDEGRVRPLVSQAAGILAMVALLTIELSLVTPDETGAVRAMSLVLLFSALHVVAFLVDRPPLSRFVSWVAIALAAVAGIGGVVREAVDPLEWATVPIAVALLVTGAVHLSRTPTARSWAWLAPGLGVLLVPSLIATFVEQPVWRLVALGVACIAAIVVGATRKLQAPLIIGAVVVLVHGLRTFAPAIRTVYELTEWWVWAVVGGAIVLFLGLTFEKRVRDLKSVSTRVSSLR